MARQTTVMNAGLVPSRFERSRLDRDPDFRRTTSGGVGFQYRLRRLTGPALQHVNRVETLGLVSGDPVCQCCLGCMSIDTQALLQVGSEIAGKLVVFFQ